MADKRISMTIDEKVVMLTFTGKQFENESPKHNPYKRLSLMAVPNKTKYRNEYENMENTEIPRPLPSKLMHQYTDISDDIEYIVKDFKIWKLVKLLVRRSNEDKEKIFNTLKEDYQKIYFGEIDQIVNYNKISNNIYFYAINSVFLVDEELDVFHMKYYDNFYGIDDIMLREILCTKSYSQINKIKKCFLKKTGFSLSRLIKHAFHNSVQKFFLQLIETERSVSTEYKQGDPFLNDFSLFTDVKYYKQNKQKFIDLFTTASYYQIRMMCLEFESQYGVSLVDNFRGCARSRLLKCAKTICQFSLNTYEYFAESLKKNIEALNPYGIIRLCTSRCEIDLTNIIREYRNKNTYNKLCCIKKRFSNIPEIYYDIILPLMGLEESCKI